MPVPVAGGRPSHSPFQPRSIRYGMSSEPRGHVLCVFSPRGAEATESATIADGSYGFPEGAPPVPSLSTADVVAESGERNARRWPAPRVMRNAGRRA